MFILIASIKILVLFHTFIITVFQNSYYGMVYKLQESNKIFILVKLTNLSKVSNVICKNSLIT